jgi:hypothetical protein
MKLKNGIIKTLFSIIVTLTIFISIQYLEFKKDEVITSDNISELLSTKEIVVKGIVEELYNTAFQLGGIQKQKIIDDVNMIYGNDIDKLRLDLLKLNEGDLEYTDLVYILEKHTKGVYFNVVNDNNDPFVAMRKVESDNKVKVIITSDFSENCQAYGRTRIEDDEVKMHFNPELARTTLRNMVIYGQRTGFWSFLKVNKSYPWYDDIKNLNTNDLDILFKLFRKYNYNMDIFKSIEFLTVTPIDRYNDLINIPSNINGLYNINSHQLFYFYNFNLIDQINHNKDYKDKIDFIDENIDKEVKQIKYKKQRVYSIMAIESMILILFALLLTSIQQYKE